MQCTSPEPLNATLVFAGSYRDLLVIDACFHWNPLGSDGYSKGFLRRGEPAAPGLIVSCGFRQVNFGCEEFMILFWSNFAFLFLVLSQRRALLEKKAFSVILAVVLACPGCKPHCKGAQMPI